MGPGSPAADASPEYEVATLEEAVARMLRVDADLPRGDGVRYFNGLYLEVTRELIRRIAAGDFEDGGFLEHLGVVFSNLYFKAVADNAQESVSVSDAWAPLFKARMDRRVAPIQFALAGMNAHINYDLPIAVRDTCHARGVKPEEGTAQYREYLRLNSVLADVQQRAQARLTPGLLGVIDRALGRLDDLVATFSVARARDAAWFHAQTLWSMRDSPHLTSSYLVVLERTVGFAGRGLVGPTLLGLARWSSDKDWLPGLVRSLLGSPRE